MPRISNIGRGSPGNAPRSQLTHRSTRGAWNGTPDDDRSRPDRASSRDGCDEAPKMSQRALRRDDGYGSGGLGEGGGPPLMQRDSRASGAPPGVTPRPPGLHPAVTWWPGCGRKARVGEAAPSVGAGGSRRFVVLRGGDSARSDQCTGRLSMAEAREIARQTRSQKAAGGRVLLMKAGRATNLPTPKHPADRTRSVLRFTKRAIGRPVGINACMAGLRAIGWCA